MKCCTPKKPACCGIGYKSIPAALGDDTGPFKPENGAYHNMLIRYEENGALYLYTNDGIFTQLDGERFFLMIEKWEHDTSEELEAEIDQRFSDLNVQSEIDHKLNEMVADGTLAEIIDAYLQTNVTWTFNTVADMKSATNLVAGSYAQTLGYHLLNDGGDALYYIREKTNTDVVDEGKLIALSDQNLVAVLVYTDNVIDVKKFGAWADGVHDDSDVFQHCLDMVHTSSTSSGTWRRTINIPAVLRITKKIECKFGNFRMVGVSKTNSRILLDNANAYLDFGKSDADVFEIEIENITFIGNYANTNPLLKFTRCINLYLTRIDTENQGEDIYGIEFNSCGLIFMDKCTIVGSNNLTDYPGNRNGIKVNGLGSIFNFTNANCWNLNHVISFVGSVQNVNIINNWIECYKSFIDFDCASTIMSYANVKIHNNTISTHNSENFAPTNVSFISYDVKEHTNMFGSVLDISNNTITFGNVTSINNNSLIYMNSVGGSASSVFSVYFDRNVFAWQNLNTLSAYVFYNSDSSFYSGAFVQIKSFEGNTNIDVTRITDERRIVKCCINEGSYAMPTFPNGIYLNKTFTNNHGNIYYASGDFYAGYAGSIKALPKNVGTAIAEANASNVVDVVNAIRSALYYAHITTLG